MVKIFSKKEKTFANGKIVATDFKYLNPSDFDYCVATKEELQTQSALLAPDGRLFVNTSQEGHELITQIFQILVPETKQVLNEYLKRYKKQYYYIKTFDDWAKMQADVNSKIYALTMLLVPIEVKRREIEQAYYFKNN